MLLKVLDIIFVKEIIFMYLFNNMEIIIIYLKLFDESLKIL